jgi:hypothetical protein
MHNVPIGILALMIAAATGGCKKGLSDEEIRRIVRDEVQEQLRERKRRQAPRAGTQTPTSTADKPRPRGPSVSAGAKRPQERLRRRIETLDALVKRFEKTPGVTKARVAMMKKQLSQMRERLARAEGGQSPLTTPTSPENTRQSRKDWLDALAAGIRALGEQRWEIDRRILDSVLKDPGFANTDAFLVPHRVNDKPQGFRLKYVRPKGFYSALGLKTGDVVERVNNTLITGPKDVTAFYTGLSKTRLATLVLRRSGRRTIHVYTIKQTTVR